MADIANFVAQNFKPVSYGNVLAQAQSLNDAKQANQMRQYQLERSQAADNALAGGDVNAMARVDPGMAGQYQGVMNAQQQTATETLARMMEAVGKSGNPKLLGAQVTQMPAFQEALKALQLDPSQFTVDDTDTDDTLRQQAMDLAQLFGGIPSMLENQAIPSDVRTAQWYAGQSPEMQGIFQDAKRAPSISTIGGVPTQTNAPGGPQPLSTLDAEVNAAAQLAGAQASAKASADAQAEQIKELTANQRTLEVWNVAKQGLVSALAGTATGPVQGRMPALTSGQQIAEGAVAAVAPVLKQLFRSAGEGVFTDRDQALLLEMVPNREDHPDTVAAKIDMIDAIIQAKLAASIPGQQAPAQTKRVKVDSEGNVIGD